jgi:hypothetical protein
MYALDRHFERYTEHSPSVPVWKITAELGRCTIRFYDTSPFSPSGRYLAVTRLPYDDRAPRPGDPCEIVVYDLFEGGHRVVGLSRCWDAQLGAQLQWGASDADLYFNDLEPGEWRPFGIKLNISTGLVQRLEGAIYMVSHDGKLSASPCLLRTARTQPGYGGVVPPDHLPLNHGAPDDDGLYLTDLDSGRTWLHVSLAQIASAIDLDGRVDGGLAGAAFYGFHAKWSPDGKRLMFVIRNKPETSNKRHSYLVTMNSDGTNIRLALGWDIWSKGGHHPNWFPSSDKVLMNLKDKNGTLRFFSFNHDGSDLKPITLSHLGSGHPTICPFAPHYLLTDTYAAEKLATRPGATASIRLLDTSTDALETLMELDTRATLEKEGVMRIDPHPTWHPSQPYIAFNARNGATRNVYVADLSHSIFRPKVAGKLSNFFRNFFSRQDANS